MTQPMTQTPPSRSFFSGLIWWKTNPADIEKQLAGYRTMKPWESARGMAVLLCAFTVAVTFALSRVVGLSQSSVEIEALMWAILAFFMYRGQPWAFIAAMIVWTLDKAAIVMGGFARLHNPVIQVLWWAIYMNVFMLGYRVEKARRARGVGVRAGV